MAVKDAHMYGVKGGSRMTFWTVSLPTTFSGRTAEEASNCFYRGGFFNWFEGGPTSSFLPQSSPGYSPQDGDKCISAGRYCSDTPDISYFYPCGNGTSGQYNTACYFGRGAIQVIVFKRVDDAYSKFS